MNDGDSEQTSPMFQKVKVNDIFTSFQGEGPHTGRHALFVRMSGCNLACEWCDTKDALEHGMMVTLNDLYKAITEHNIRYIVFTGGEPLVQYVRLKPLFEMLRDENYTIAIETNGTVRVPAEEFDLIVVSPKSYESAKPWIEAVRTRNLQNVYFKPVVNKDNMMRWVEYLQDIDPKLVYYMPMGADVQELMESTNDIIGFLISRKIEGNLGLRLHIMMGLK